MREIDIEINFISGTKKEDQNEQSSLAVAFSLNLISSLEEKVKKHNLENLNKVSIKQLKEVYSRGSLNSEEGKSPGLCAMARVNMFLRMTATMTSKAVNRKFGRNSIKTFELDLTEDWVPTTEDFEASAKEIEASNLNYDFKDINELYLDDKCQKSNRFWFDL